VVPLLADIQLAAERAADLTRQLLAYSGKGRFVVEALDVNRVVDEMAHLLSTVISKKASLRFALRPDLPMVKADATQLRQVVMNLITNASDALAGKVGLINVTSGTVDADAEYLASAFVGDPLPPGPYVFLEVSDTGAGMDPATQERIFDPFFTTKFTGHGLGLAAVLGILRSHRGTIKVYSEPGRGSTFKVLLPAALDGTSEATAPRAAIAHPGVGLVLVCDDDAAVRAVAARVLEGAGYAVITAADGLEAVQRFAERSGEIVAVLLDMTMPGLSGDEVFRELRRRREDVRVVLSSGYNEQDATSHFVGKGLAGFLPKPWRPDDLLAAVRRAQS
jgi:CheY-like chemotaxis protein